MRLEWIKITTRQRLIGYIAVIFYYYHATKSHISYNDWSVVNDDGERKGSSGVSREVEFQQDMFQKELLDLGFGEHATKLLAEGALLYAEKLRESLFDTSDNSDEFRDYLP